MVRKSRERCSASTRYGSGMRELAITALAWVYNATLAIGPFALAVYIVVRYEASHVERIERIIDTEAARGELGTPGDVYMRKQALWKRFGWREAVLFLAVWISIQALAEFIRFNAHNIVREAHSISQDWNRDD